ncbi:hypothetical protein KV100_07470 [Mumia sp. zg.B21]|uniref:DUF6270 domain-containing protein n=1 Tax=Mumia sp. zg.B21 TaxID=2855447 RepID=UPI001C6EE07C|nr:DUF6270 domain-containing protein [Mumia sp. zg.B21]MBW9209491.1 hypothetical protein [Mumia sp. zg.B21]
MSEVRSIALFGSCMTRDNFNSRFNPHYKATYRCDVAQNQMSVLSLMSEPITERWEPTKAMSDYDVWNIRTEFDKAFLGELAGSSPRPDYLLLDFFGDAHFGVLQLDDGRIITDNRWKVHATDFYQRLRDEGRLTRLHPTSDPDAYFALWSEAVDRFAEHVRLTLPETRVVVHCGHHTNLLMLPDRPRPGRLQKHRSIARIDVEAANDQWRRMDAYAVEAFGAAAIDLTGEDFPTFDDHPWGPFYVHYRMDYYHRFLAELHKIVIGDGATPTPQMVADIELAAGETPTLRLAACEEERAALKERLMSRKEEVAQLRSRVARLERTPWRRAASRLRRTRAFRARRP